MVTLVDYCSSESDKEIEKDTESQKGKKKKVIVIQKPTENSTDTSDSDDDNDEGLKSIRTNTRIRKTPDLDLNTDKHNSLLGRLPQAKNSIGKNSHVFSHFSKFLPQTDSKSHSAESSTKKLEPSESGDFDIPNSVSFFSLESEDGVGTKSSLALQIDELEKNGLQATCGFDVNEHENINNNNNNVTGDLNDFMIPNREFHFDSISCTTNSKSVPTRDDQFVEFHPIFAKEPRIMFKEQQLDSSNEQTGFLKRKKVGPDMIPDTILEISQEEILSTGREYLKNISKPVDVISIPKSELPDATSRKRHQITFLAFKAKEQEASLKNAWAQSKTNRVQSKKRYGFA